MANLQNRTGSVRWSQTPLRPDASSELLTSFFSLLFTLWARLERGCETHRSNRIRWFHHLIRTANWCSRRRSPVVREPLAPRYNSVGTSGKVTPNSTSIRMGYKTRFWGVWKSILRGINRYVQNRVTESVSRSRVRIGVRIMMQNGGQIRGIKRV